jgi:hypothetical protein
MGTLVKGAAVGVSDEEPPASSAPPPEDAAFPAAAEETTLAPTPKPEPEAKPEATTPAVPAEAQEVPPIPVRICAVAGYDGRVNDIVYCPPSVRSDHNKAVIYFGGDVQVFLIFHFANYMARLFC